MVRIGSVHTFSHFSNDDDTHCELCEIIVLGNQLTPLLDNAVEEFECKNCIFLSESPSYLNYDSPMHCFAAPVCFHNKPPPTT